MALSGNSRIRNVLFDLDGTLIDSAEEITDCLNKAFGVNGLNKFVIDRSHIGPPVQDMILAIAPDLEKNVLNNILKEFRSLYDNSRFLKTRLYNGVTELLEELQNRDIKSFIVTNKPWNPTRAILSKFRMDNFADVICPDIDSAGKLSKSEMIAVIIEKWHLEKSETMMVGDTESDVLSARRNGIVTVALLNGYGDNRRLMESNPDYLINDLNMLHNILKIRHLRGGLRSHEL